MKFVLLMTALFSMSAMATSINFKCDFTDYTFVNEFSLEAKNIDVTDGVFHDAEFDFTLRKAGRDSQLERLVVTRDGTFKEIPAGTMYRQTVYSLISVVKGADVEYINFFLDAKTPHTSAIRFLDGRMFYGSCKTF